MIDFDESFFEISTSTVLSIIECIHIEETKIKLLQTGKFPLLIDYLLHLIQNQFKQNELSVTEGEKYFPCDNHNLDNDDDDEEEEEDEVEDEDEDEEDNENDAEEEAEDNSDEKKGIQFKFKEATLHDLSNTMIILNSILEHENFSHFVAASQIHLSLKKLEVCLLSLPNSVEKKKYEEIRNEFLFIIFRLATELGLDHTEPLTEQTNLTVQFSNFLHTDAKGMFDFINNYFEKMPVLIKYDRMHSFSSLPSTSALFQTPLAVDDVSGSNQLMSQQLLSCQLIHSPQSVLRDLLPFCFSSPPTDNHEINAAKVAFSIKKEIGSTMAVDSDFKFAKTKSYLKDQTISFNDQIESNKDQVKYTVKYRHTVHSDRSFPIHSDTVALKRKQTKQSGSFTPNLPTNQSSRFGESTEPYLATEPVESSNNEFEKRFCEGWSIAVRGMQQRVKETNQISYLLSSVFGQSSSGANLYVTPPGSQALPAHYDDHCVFVCQLHGKKVWKVYEPPFSLPSLYEVRTKPNVEVMKGKTYVVEKGDVLYIPRGWVHEACTEQEGNNHIDEHKVDDVDVDVDGDGDDDDDDDNHLTCDYNEKKRKHNYFERNLSLPPAPLPTPSSSSSSSSLSLSSLSSSSSSSSSSSVHVTFGIEVESPFTWEGFFHIAFITCFTSILPKFISNLKILLNDASLNISSSSPSPSPSASPSPSPPPPPPCMHKVMKRKEALILFPPGTSKTMDVMKCVINKVILNSSQSIDWREENEREKGLNRINVMEKEEGKEKVEREGERRRKGFMKSCKGSGESENKEDGDERGEGKRGKDGDVKGKGIGKRGGEGNHGEESQYLSLFHASFSIFHLFIHQLSKRIIHFRKACMVGSLLMETNIQEIKSTTKNLSNQIDEFISTENDKNMSDTLHPYQHASHRGKHDKDVDMDDCDVLNPEIFFHKLLDLIQNELDSDFDFDSDSDSDSDLMILTFTELENIFTVCKTVNELDEVECLDWMDWMENVNGFDSSSSFLSPSSLSPSSPLLSPPPSLSPSSSSSPSPSSSSSPSLSPSLSLSLSLSEAKATTAQPILSFPYHHGKTMTKRNVLLEFCSSSFFIHLFSEKQVFKRFHLILKALMKECIIGIDYVSSKTAYLKFIEKYRSCRTKISNGFLHLHELNRK